MMESSQDSRPLVTQKPITVHTLRIQDGVKPRYHQAIGCAETHYTKLPVQDGGEPRALIFWQEQPPTDTHQEPTTTIMYMEQLSLPFIHLLSVVCGLLLACQGQRSWISSNAHVFALLVTFSLPSVLAVCLLYGSHVSVMCQ